VRGGLACSSADAVREGEDRRCDGCMFAALWAAFAMSAAMICRSDEEGFVMEG